MFCWLHDRQTKKDSRLLHFGVLLNSKEGSLRFSRVHLHTPCSTVNVGIQKTPPKVPTPSPPGKSHLQGQEPSLPSSLLNRQFLLVGAHTCSTLSRLGHQTCQWRDPWGYRALQSLHVDVATSTAVSSGWRISPVSLLLSRMFLKPIANVCALTVDLILGQSEWLRASHGGNLTSSQKPRKAHSKRVLLLCGSSTDSKLIVINSSRLAGLMPTLPRWLSVKTGLYGDPLWCRPRAPSCLEDTSPGAEMGESCCSAPQKHPSLRGEADTDQLKGKYSPGFWVQLANTIPEVLSMTG